MQASQAQRRDRKASKTEDQVIPLRLQVSIHVFLPNVSVHQTAHFVRRTVQRMVGRYFFLTLKKLADSISGYAHSIAPLYTSTPKYIEFTLPVGPVDNLGPVVNQFGFESNWLAVSIENSTSSSDTVEIVKYTNSPRV